MKNFRTALILLAVLNICFAGYMLLRKPPQAILYEYDFYLNGEEIPDPVGDEFWTYDENGIWNHFCYMRKVKDYD